MDKPFTPSLGANGVLNVLYIFTFVWVLKYFSPSAMQQQHPPLPKHALEHTLSAAHTKTYSTTAHNRAQAPPPTTPLITPSPVVSSPTPPPPTRPQYLPPSSHAHSTTYPAPTPTRSSYMHTTSPSMTASSESSGMTFP
ncbi:extensin-like [Penaeus monodon]|uniref:extensin-like n=1 Tax=Penaeus monodon TaxID=6687 RepID=UPI0018A71400|nr:extensin-like [Penaeus monodon]